MTVNLKSNDLTEQLWGNWNQAKEDNDTLPFTLSVILNGDESTKYSNATLSEDGWSVVYTIDLPALAEGTGLHRGAVRGRKRHRHKREILRRLPASPWNWCSTTAEGPWSAP